MIQHQGIVAYLLLQLSDMISVSWLFHYSFGVRLHGKLKQAYLEAQSASIKRAWICLATCSFPSPLQTNRDIQKYCCKVFMYKGKSSSQLCCNQYYKKTISKAFISSWSGNCLPSSTCPQHHGTAPWYSPEYHQIQPESPTPSSRLKDKGYEQHKCGR